MAAGENSKKSEADLHPMFRKKPALIWDDVPDVDNEERMTKIRTVTDIEPFMGKFVLIKSTAWYYTRCRRFMVGYVNGHSTLWNGTEYGAVLQMLLHEDDIAGSFAVIDSKLKQTEFSIRKLTKEEKHDVLLFLQNNLDKVKLGDYDVQTFWKIHPCNKVFSQKSKNTLKVVYSEYVPSERSVFYRYEWQKIMPQKVVQTSDT